MKKLLIVATVLVAVAGTVIAQDSSEQNVRARFMEYISTIEDDDLFVPVLQGAQCAIPVSVGHPLEARQKLIELIDSTEDEALLDDMLEGGLFAASWAVWAPPESTCDLWRQKAKDCWDEYNGCLEDNDAPSACHATYTRCAYWDERLEDCDDGSGGSGGGGDDDDDNGCSDPDGDGIGSNGEICGWPY